MNQNTPVKFSLGLFQLGIGFLFFSISARYMDGSARVPMMFLLTGWLFVTTGELFLSPIGLSKITELAPTRLAAFLMGVWFLSSAFAHYIAGGIAKLTVPAKVDTEYVANHDIFTKFSSWASGMDQNEVGSFMFKYDNAYNSLLDTTQIGYATKEKLNSYLTTLSTMNSVNDQWAQNASQISADVALSSSLIDSLNTYTDTSLLSNYNTYLKMVVKKSNTESFANAYGLLKEKEKIKTENEIVENGKALDKISKKWTLAAEEMIGYENIMIEKNSTWANVVFNYTSAIDKNKLMVKPYPALATYSKVFAQIALLSFFIAIFAFVISPLLKYWMHGIK